MIGLWRFYRGGAEGNWGKREFGEEGIRELENWGIRQYRGRGKSCMMPVPSGASGHAEARRGIGGKGDLEKRGLGN
jgi:hypothetical protein